MALLSWRCLSFLVPSSAVILTVGCSFVLDTDSLRKGGSGQAGAGGSAATTAGSGGTAGGGDMVDASMCSFPDRDPCTECLGTSCCAEYTACARDITCNVAFVTFQTCAKAAERAPNPAMAHAMCTQNYIMRGGMPASGLVGCTLQRCSAVCT